MHLYELCTSLPSRIKNLKQFAELVIPLSQQEVYSGLGKETITEMLAEVSSTYEGLWRRGTVDIEGFGDSTSLLELHSRLKETDETGKFIEERRSAESRFHCSDIQYFPDGLRTLLQEGAKRLQKVSSQKWIATVHFREIVQN